MDVTNIQITRYQHKCSKHSALVSSRGKTVLAVNRQHAWHYCIGQTHHPNKREVQTGTTLEALGAKLQWSAIGTKACGLSRYLIFYQRASSRRGCRRCVFLGILGFVSLFWIKRHLESAVSTAQWDDSKYQEKCYYQQKHFLSYPSHHNTIQAMSIW